MAIRTRCRAPALACVCPGDGSALASGIAGARRHGHTALCYSARESTSKVESGIDSRCFALSLLPGHAWRRVRRWGRGRRLTGSWRRLHGHRTEHRHAMSAGVHTLYVAEIIFSLHGVAGSHRRRIGSTRPCLVRGCPEHCRHGELLAFAVVGSELLETLSRTRHHRHSGTRRRVCTCPERQHGGK